MNSIFATIIDALFSFYILLVLVRGLLTLVSADFYNVLCQFIYRMTEPPLAIIRPWIPSWGAIDLSCWVFAYVLQIIQFLILGWIFQQSMQANMLFVGSMIDMTRTVIHIYIFSLIILAISSWFVSPAQRLGHPLLSMLQILTEPLLRPVRRIFSITGPIDFSVMIVVFLLYILSSILQLFLFRM